MIKRLCYLIIDIEEMKQGTRCEGSILILNKLIRYASLRKYLETAFDKCGDRRLAGVYRRTLHAEETCQCKDPEAEWYPRRPANSKNRGPVWLNR